MVLTFTAASNAVSLAAGLLVTKIPNMCSRLEAGRLATELPATCIGLAAEVA